MWAFISHRTTCWNVNALNVRLFSQFHVIDETFQMGLGARPISVAMPQFHTYTPFGDCDWLFYIKYKTRSLKDQRFGPKKLIFSGTILTESRKNILKSKMQLSNIIILGILEVFDGVDSIPTIKNLNKTLKNSDSEVRVSPDFSQKPPAGTNCLCLRCFQ